jgi:hypothetical protein
MSERMIERVIAPSRGESRGHPALGGVGGHFVAPHDE